MTLEEFNKKYKYKKDIDKYGFNEVWLEPKEVDGRYEGDCEDYCIYLKRNVPEFKDWEYWYCKINGNGHCVLYKNGDTIDCNCKTVLNIEQYIKIYNATNFKKYNNFVVFSKILVGKLLNLALKVLAR